MQKSEKKGLIVLVVITILAITIPVARNVTASKVSFSGSNTSGTRANLRPSLKTYIAELYITGTIQEKNSEYNQEWLLKTISFLKNDEKNLGIILFIDSPGGTVYHADEAYIALLDYKSTGKKLYAYFGSMAASGGYYIGCAADKIYANRNSLLGSIGVISAQTIDATSLMEKIGIKSVTVHAGKNKNMLNYNEPATEEQLNIMQALADECYQQFTEIVSLSRKMDIDKVKELADGRIYSAKQGKENGLIDEIATLEEAELLIKTDFQEEMPIFKSFRYQKPDSLRTFFLDSLSFLRPLQGSFSEKTLLRYQ